MRSYGQRCGLAKALDVVGDRWMLLIVRELLIRGPSRYTDLKNGLPGIATNLLAERLRELPVDPRRDQRGRRPSGELARDLLEQWPFPVGQVRRRPSSGGADERRVGAVREHLHLAPPGHVGRGADVVGVEVRQHQAPQVRGLVPGPADRVGEQRRGAGKAGIDEREPVGVAPQVGVTDRKADEVQPR